jgi:hypothetical protein
MGLGFCSELSRKPADCLPWLSLDPVPSSIYHARTLLQRGPAGVPAFFGSLRGFFLLGANAPPAWFVYPWEDTMQTVYSLRGV